MQYDLISQIWLHISQCDFIFRNCEYVSANCDFILYLTGWLHINFNFLFKYCDILHLTFMTFHLPNKFVFHNCGFITHISKCDYISQLQVCFCKWWLYLLHLAAASLFPLMWLCNSQFDLISCSMTFVIAALYLTVWFYFSF